MSTLLELRDLSVGYGSTQVLNSLNLTVGDGEIVALLGPSGSGKSTLLNAVAGFLPIHNGEILLAGRNIATPRKAEPPVRRDIRPGTSWTDSVSVRSRIGDRHSCRAASSSG